MFLLQKDNSMKEIKEIEVDGDIIYLRKDSLGWRTINPIKNKDGSINWKNLIAGGSWIKLAITIGFVLLIVLSIWEYTHNINILMSCFDNPLALDTCKESFNYPDFMFN